MASATSSSGNESPQVTPVMTLGQYIQSVRAVSVPAVQKVHPPGKETEGVTSVTSSSGNYSPEVIPVITLESESIGETPVNSATGNKSGAHPSGKETMGMSSVNSTAGNKSPDGIPVITVGRESVRRSPR